MFATTAVLARVAVIDIAADPSKLALPVTSDVRAIFLVVVSVLAVVALPENAVELIVVLTVALPMAILMVSPETETFEVMGRTPTLVTLPPLRARLATKVLA